jgi:hypothetical protein
MKNFESQTLLLLLMITLAITKHPNGECGNLKEKDQTWGIKGTLSLGVQ